MRPFLIRVPFGLLAAGLVACESPSTRIAGPIGQVPAGWQPTPSAPSSNIAISVDSFTVIEYRPTCVWDCPYLVYAPLIKLRVPAGAGRVEVVSVRFTLGSVTTGDCSGSVKYSPGTSAFLDGIYPYAWSNDLIFVSLDGTPLPGDVATASLTVRAEDGTLGTIEATGTVQRKVANPQFPAPRSNGWMCQQ